MATDALIIDIGAEIKSANEKFVRTFAQGDAKGMAQLYSEDCMLLPAGTDIIRGREAVQNFWQFLMDLGSRHTTLESIEVEQHGDKATEIGYFSVKGENGEVLEHGKYIVIWKRENCDWKLHRDIFNSNRAPEQG